MIDIKELLKVCLDIKAHCDEKGGCEKYCEYSDGHGNCKIRDTFAYMGYYVTPKDWNIEKIKKGLVKEKVWGSTRG